MHSKISRRTAALFLAGWLVSANAWADQAGRVQFVTGTVQILSKIAGVTRALYKGDTINEGDTLVSGKSSSAQIRMRDGGFIAVRPETHLKFDNFKFNGKADGTEKGFFSLLKGGFRAITGLIGRVNKENYRITTAAATIGVRGTDHEVYVLTPDSPLVLSGAAEPGTYDKVNVGETVLTTSAGTIIIPPNRMGFAPGMDQLPKVALVDARIFNLAAPIVRGAEQSRNGAEPSSGKHEQKNISSPDQPPGEYAADGSKPPPDGSLPPPPDGMMMPPPDGSKPPPPDGVIMPPPGGSMPPPPDGMMMPPPGGSMPPPPDGMMMPPPGGSLLPPLLPPPLPPPPISTTQPTQTVQGVAGFAYCAPSCTNGFADVMQGVVDEKGALIGFKSQAGMNGGLSNNAIIAQHGMASLPNGASLNWGEWVGPSAVTGPAGFTGPNVPQSITRLHYIGGEAPSMMPVTGTANFVPIGGTAPTDANFKVGQFMGASIAVNFGTGTVNLTNLTIGMGTKTFTMAGTAPSAFNPATGILAVGSLAGTCAPTCASPSASGNYTGTFVGAGAAGLGLAYQVTGSIAGSVDNIAGAQGFKKTP